MSVKLREKQLSDGRISLYLDIYHDKKRSYQFLEIYLDGKRKNADTDKEKRTLAEKIKKSVEDRLKSEQWGLPSEFQPNADLLEFILNRQSGKQSAMKTLRFHLKEFTKLERIPFKMVTKDWLLALQTYLLNDPGRSKNSVNTYMNQINTILNEAEQEEIIPANPWKKVPSHLKTKYSSNPIDPLEPAEIRLLIENSKGIHPQVRQCFLFSIFTGLRWSDASNLTKDSIRTFMVEGKRRKFIVFTQIKTRTTKNLPLSSDAVRMLTERLLDERTGINNKRDAGLKVESNKYFFPYLIPDPETNVSRHDRMSRQLKKWAKQAGITKRVHYHLSRHTFATLGIEKIGDLHIVSSLLGHKKLATTQRYAHVLDRLKVESIDRLSSFGILR